MNTGLQHIDVAVQCINRIGLRRRIVNGIVPEGMSFTVLVSPWNQAAPPFTSLPVDFNAMDRAALPEGTIQSCLRLGSCYPQLSQLNGFMLTGNEQFHYFVYPDGRLCAVVQNQQGQMALIEECWERHPMQGDHHEATKNKASA
jgi:hypothetical protein